jgi:hypothetical protein
MDAVAFVLVTLIVGTEEITGHRAHRQKDRTGNPL